MANIMRLRVPWGGSSVIGGGLSTFYYPSGSTTSTITAQVNTFFTAIKDQFPQGTSWSIPATGDLIDEATGELTGAWSGGTSAVITSTATATTYTAGAGARVRWDTSNIYGGRRVRGATYLIPLRGPGYDTDGTIAAATLTTLSNAAAALVSATQPMLIWSRPKLNDAGTAVERPGQAFFATASTVPDKVSTLRSRRV